MMRPQQYTIRSRQHKMQQNPYPHINTRPHTAGNKPFAFSNISGTFPNSSSSHPPRHISYMADPLDRVLDTNTFNLEWMAGQGEYHATPETLEQLLENANNFLGLRETLSPMETIFVDRLTKVLERIRKLIPGGDLIGLEDFINRQKRVTLEAELAQLKVCGYLPTCGKRLT